MVFANLTDNKTGRSHGNKMMRRRSDDDDEEEEEEESDDENHNDDENHDNLTASKSVVRQTQTKTILLTLQLSLL